jgi:hydroxyacylglutathione hydrolase
MTSIELPDTPDVEVLQIHTAGLGDNSYVIRSGDELAVVDPQRDLDRIEDAIAQLGGRLVAVLETHVHNDYVSGGPALAARHGATYAVPANAGHTLAHTPLSDGDEVAVGSLRLRALHTPGHTPHHTSYGIVDRGAIRGVFTGGSVLVGACGRTDLVSAEQTEGLTRSQYRSAQRIASFGEPTAIAPTHGAGSFCAASAASADTWSTVALERTRNPAYLAPGEDEFVRGQLAGLLAYPAYYSQMAALNRRGLDAWEAAPVASLSPAEVEERQARGEVVVDGRSRGAFAGGHIPGSVNIELDVQFGTYIGWLLPFGAPVVLVLDPGQDPGEAVRQCARIGIESIVGVLEGGIAAWTASGRRTSTYPTTDVDGLHHALEAGTGSGLDVRQDAEWTAGHVPGARHLHVADLPGRVGELRDMAAPVYVYCRTGHRAAIAASMLDAAGIPAVHVDGGFPDWVEHGFPVSDAR